MDYAGTNGWGQSDRTASETAREFQKCQKWAKEMPKNQLAHFFSPKKKNHPSEGGGMQCVKWMDK